MRNDQVASDWLTNARISRVALALQAISKLDDKPLLGEVHRFIWRKCGGPFEEVSSILHLLTELRFVSLDGIQIYLSKLGKSLSCQAPADIVKSIGKSLITAGYLHDQVRFLLDSSSPEPDGGIRIEITKGRTLAPQLLGIIQQWERVTVYPDIYLPADVVREVAGLSALLPKTIEVPEWVLDQKSVGNRAEAYSLQYERLRVPAASLLWVSRDSDRLGYDIEDVSVVPSRYIEVKGTRDSKVLFYLSETQLARARSAPDRFEVHFWGDIDLRKEPEHEYRTLRAAGYPLIIRDISTGSWQFDPVEWRVTPREHRDVDNRS